LVCRSGRRHEAREERRSSSADGDGRVDLVGKNGRTAADMANGPRERIQPFPETIARLIELGSTFSNRRNSC
jgi:hypothetical protein